MSKRKIVKIDEAKCNGCGLCIPSCAEGALQIVNGKAKIVKDMYCDGLGACLGHCPQGAITIIEREAENFNEKAVIKHVEEMKKKKEERVMKDNIPCGCPGAMLKSFDTQTKKNIHEKIEVGSEITQWPVQLMLVPASAPFLNKCDLLVCADCVPFAYANFHQDLLAGKKMLIGCPKLDDLELYIDKLTEIIKNQNLNSLTVAIMEVPCCGGLLFAVEEAVKRAGVDIKINKQIIGIRGNKK